MKPDFDSGKGYYWMKQTHAAIQSGTRDNLPHKPETPCMDHFSKEAREHMKHAEFKEHVERRLSRKTFIV